MVDTLHPHDDNIVQFAYMGSDTKSKAASSSSRMYKKVVINKHGKYEYWRCGSDTEMMYRLMNKYKVHTLSTPLFIRREHDESLTHSKETGWDSAYRKEIWNKIKKRYGKT